MAKEDLACIALMANPKGTARAKHIDTAHHVVQERVAMGAVTFYHQPGAEIAAKGLTNTLAGAALADVRRRLRLVEQGEPGRPPSLM